MSEHTSSANDDERRDNLVNGESHRQCATCWAIIPRTTAGEIITRDCGACYHVAFLMSGLADPDNLTQVEGKINLGPLERAETRNRPSSDERDKLMAEGMRWWDITDIRNKHYWCRHHQHSLARAADIFAFYGDDFEPYRKYTPELLTKWFDDGMPLVQHTPVKLSNAIIAVMPDDSIPQIPDAYLKDYSPCSMCVHYERSLDEERQVAIPHRGSCTIGARNRGALALVSNKPRVTYDFLSCNNFFMSQDREAERTERPSQLFGFAELNPMSDPMTLLSEFYVFTPRAYLPAPLSDEEMEVLGNTDLVTLSQARIDDVDHLAFAKDMGTMPVARHFAKQIKVNSKVENLHWGRYSHYADLGLGLYEGNEGNQDEFRSSIPITAPDAVGGDHGGLSSLPLRDSADEDLPDGEELPGPAVPVK